MSRSNRSLPQKSDKTDPFEERVDNLFEELAFAVGNDRPSILLSPYASEYIRAEVELTLEKRLRGIGQQIIRVTVDEERFDIPLFLSNHPERQKAVFSLSGLSRGGGRQGANAYRALNIRRELLVDNCLRTLFWVNPAESVELSHHAPDFWAFRHRVIEFDALADLERLPLPIKGNLACKQVPVDPFGFDLEISRFKRSFAALTAEEADQEERFMILSELADLYREKGEYNRSIRHSLKGLRLLPGNASGWTNLGWTYVLQGRAESARLAFKKALKNSSSYSPAWTGLGEAYRGLGRAIAALEASRKATVLNPTASEPWLRLADLSIDLGLWDEARSACVSGIRIAPSHPGFWFLLARLFHLEQQFADAIINYKKSIDLDPNNICARISLAACHYRLGEASLAEEQLHLIQPQVEKSPAYLQAAYEAVYGNIPAAVKWLAAALEQGQLDLSRLFRDPNFDLIREDVRFKNLWS
jgi:tetratricopeptide (TPR) repeat protein